MNRLLDKIMLYLIGVLTLMLVLDLAVLTIASAASHHLHQKVLEDTGKVITEKYESSRQTYSMMEFLGVS